MTIEGNLNAESFKICIVVSRFNDLITEKLLGGAKDCFIRHGGKKEHVDVAYVPGAFELPVVSKKAALSKKYDGILALGCVIRGSTAHFDYVAGEASKGLSSVSMNEGIAVGFGLLTTDTLEQALERAGSKQGNKGWEACVSLIETIHVLHQFDQ